MNGVTIKFDENLQHLILVALPDEIEGELSVW